MTIALVLLSALLHAAWNALLKREPAKDTTLIAAIGVGAIASTVFACIRAGVTGVPLFASGVAVGYALLAGAFEQLYFLALARALDRGPLAQVYTITRGGAVVVVYPLSIALLGEAVSTTAWIGSAIVLAGIVLSGLWTPGANKPGADPRAAVAWSVAGACVIAGYHVAYKAAIDAGGAPSAVFALSIGFASAINVARAPRAQRRAVVDMIRTRAPAVLAMAVLASASFLLLIDALAGSGAGFALTLRNTSVLFALGFAWLIGERPRALPVIGAALVATGAIVMAR